MHPFLRSAPLLVCALTTMSLLPSFAAAAETKAAAAKPRLTSRVFAWGDLPVKPTPVGERRDVANNPTATLAVFECHITTLNPGAASHDPHRHPQEELIIVKEGRVEVHIEGRTQIAGPGSVFLYNSNDAHAVRNAGHTRAIYWVINVASAITHTPAAHNPNPTQPSAVFDWEKLTATPTKNGARRAILKGSTRTLKDLSVHATTVAVGEAAHGAHRHPDDEIVLVKEGTLEATIDGVPHRAPTGSVLFFGSNDLHGMRNAGDTPVTYFVIRLVTAATPPAAPPAKS